MTVDVPGQEIVYIESVKPQSDFLDVHGLRYHVRRWGDPNAPTLFMLHGWMDVSASFQFVVDALRGDWHVVAPDWRGFGLTDWAAGTGYRLLDLHADLERILDHYQPRGAVDLVGHSMGGNVAWLYAGIRPARVRRVVSLDGYCGTPAEPGDYAAQCAHWLDRLSAPASLPDFASLDEVTRHLLDRSPRMTVPQAGYLAVHWSQARDDGRRSLRADPRHKLREPSRYPREQIRALWRAARASVLHVEAAESRAFDQAAKGAGPHALRQELDALDAHRTVRFDAAGHMLHHEVPAQVADAIEQFLRASL
ncbi:MAG TPA: alpha/beta hydrolase [Paraburkholderia sp.]